MSPARLGTTDRLLGVAALILLGVTLGVVRNHLAPEPLALLQPWSPPTPLGARPVEAAEALTLHASGALFVDARELVRYEEGHVAGALHLDPEELARLRPGPATGNLLYTLRAAPEVVIYCDGPECRASTRLAELLIEAGVPHLRIFHEGWPGWEAAGGPAAAIP